MQSNRIHCSRASGNSFVHVCSSAEFYSKQIRWCIETVSEFWSSLPKDSRLFPEEIPREIRFCLSWILGTDVTEVKSHTIYSWMCRHLGFHQSAEDKLKGVSVESLTHPSSIHVLLAPPPVKYTFRMPGGRYDFSIRHYTESERDAIASLWFMPFVVISRPTGHIREVPSSVHSTEEVAEAAASDC